ncbi:protein phosphatase 1 regulatory subunit 21-like [Orbicella faveolata]|uniref:protein phosphatase 1 regulatory subunit 21-like n=1 Tax=Orbicella faveolata TaxID=48498 RepID=UPI0009E435A3|nr:protein phosphatase 1 regulatory subunit 21-like [Orbicella faveolata]
MSADSQTLQAKYQKLAAEFAKQRAQNTVLKKAVIEEQEKTKTLQETVRQKDQSIRKYEQEIDSLQFRNDQLSKRVSVLQEELDDYDGKNRRGKSRIDGMVRGDDNDVKDQELQIKIQENERLQRELYETTQEHKGTILTLQEKLEALERNSTDHQKILDEANGKHKMVLDKLNEERALLEAKLHKTEEELKVASFKAEKGHQQLKLLHKEMTSRYDDVSKVVTEKLPFNDTSIRELNKLNVPTHDRKHQVKAKEVICQAVELVRELVSGMSNFLTYTEQNACYVPGTLLLHGYCLSVSLPHLLPPSFGLLSLLLFPSPPLPSIPFVSSPVYSPHLPSLFSSTVLSTHFQSKVSLEHQLPTATQTLKSTDECIVSSLVSLLTATAKIARFMNSNLDFISTKTGVRTRGMTTAVDSELTSSPAVVEFRHHAADYIQKLIKTQIAVTHERISKLEEAKEHWMLESQLLQVKYEKEAKFSFFQGEEEETRETLIKNHFTQRIAELTSQVQFTESKTVSITAECRALYRRMKQSEKAKQELAKNLKTANSKVSQLEDEAETIKRSYETQLSMMSDHLCGMNEKLTSQQDEIEVLKSGKLKKGKLR